MESSVCIDDRMKEMKVILLEIDLLNIGFLPFKTCMSFILELLELVYDICGFQYIMWSNAWIELAFSTPLKVFKEMLE